MYNTLDWLWQLPNKNKLKLTAKFLAAFLIYAFLTSARLQTSDYPSSSVFCVTKSIHLWIIGQVYVLIPFLSGYVAHIIPMESLKALSYSRSLTNFPREQVRKHTTDHKLITGRMKSEIKMLFAAAWNAWCGVRGNANTNTSTTLPQLSVNERESEKPLNALAKTKLEQMLTMTVWPREPTM